MKKKIIPIIALSLIAIIAVTTVVFAICTVSYKPNFQEVSYISIHNSSTNEDTFYDKINGNDEDKQIVSKLNQLFNDSFNESALNSLFNGRLGYGAELIKNESAITNLSNVSKYICFEYFQESLPTIKYNDEEIPINRILIKLEDSLTTTNLGTVNIYLLQADATSSSYYYKTYGNFYNFFKYINDTVLAE